MRRPLCVFCAGMLGVALICAFLPQTELFVPFAAFFVPALLWLLFGKNSRGYGVCLLLGALAGLLLTAHTRQKLDRVHTAYADREVTLTAEVEEVSASYYPGVVHAVLRVERVNGRAAEFRVECDTLPVCEAGERVEGRFALEAPEPAGPLRAGSTSPDTAAFFLRGRHCPERGISLRNEAPGPE